MAETAVQPQYTSPEGLEQGEYEYIDLVMESIRSAPEMFQIALRGMIARETTFDKGRVADPLNFSEHRPQPPLPLSPTDLVLDIFARRYDRGIEFDDATQAAIERHPLYLEMLRLRDENSGRQLLARGAMSHDVRDNPKAQAYGRASRMARFLIFAEEMQARASAA